MLEADVPVKVKPALCLFFFRRRSVQREERRPLIEYEWLTTSEDLLSLI